MKLVLATIVSIIAALTAFASSPLERMFGTNVVYTTLMSDGSTNSWTLKDFGQALGMMNRMYHRKIKTTAGRREYHGALKKEIVDTNALIKVEVYEDGMCFTNKFKVVTPSDAVKKYNSKLKTTFTNGVPAALAAARARRLREISSTNVVTITVTPGGVL